MNVLVLGGCGFIGSHLVDRLLWDGHNVRVFDRSKERFRNDVAGVNYTIGDLSNSDALRDATADCDVVYHLISTTVPSTSNSDPAADVEQNLIPTISLLRILVECGKPKIVFLSSGGTVYGIPKKLPVTEDHVIAPICSHGIVKAAIENYIQMYAYLDKLKYVVLRVSNPYGIRQGQSGIQGVIGTFVATVLRGDEIHIWGDGSVVRDFLFIDDLIELCIRAGLGTHTGIFNAGSGSGHSIAEVVATLQRVIGRPVSVVHDKARTFDVPMIFLDICKASEAFGWRPKVNLEEGIQRIWSAASSSTTK